LQLNFSFGEHPKERFMKRMHYPLCVVFMLGLIATDLFAQDGRLGNMQLLPGYTHQTRQGIDSLIGGISKPNGLRFGYEIGRVTKPGRARTGGSFIDGPRQQREDQIRWYREQTVNGQPIHLAYRNDDLLLVSFPHKGLNISVRVRDANEMAEALLMIMTYPASGMVNDSSETTGDGGVIEVQPRGLSKANLRDIEKLADRLTSDAEELHDEYHEHLESVKHGGKLDSDVSEMERIAKSLSGFSKKADGSEESILRLRADTNDLLRLSWQIGRTVDLIEKWARDSDVARGISHVREVAADVVNTTLAIDNFLAVDTNVFDGQVARMEGLVKELHNGFHEHLEEYEVSDDLDEVLLGLERQVEHIHDLAHNKKWKNIDLKHILDETNAARRTTEQIESLLLKQVALGVREKDRACIEHSWDSIGDVLASAQLIEHMINKQERRQFNPPAPVAKQPRMSVTNLGPGALRLDLPNGSKIVQPNSSISISIGISPINLVALNDEVYVDLQHDGNGKAKFWDVDEQEHYLFRQNTGIQGFILAKDRPGYHLEQDGSKVLDQEQKPRDAPRAGKTTVKRGAIIVQIAEVSETHDDETVTVAEIYEVAEDFTIAHLQAPQRIDSQEAIQNFAKQITESLNQRPILETSKLEINGHVEETKNYRKTYRSVLLIKGAWEAHGDHRVFKIFGEGIMLVNPSNSANFKWRRASSFTPDR
jgi:hypothetical protein